MIDDSKRIVYWAHRQGHGGACFSVAPCGSFFLVAYAAWVLELQVIALCVVCLAACRGDDTNCIYFGVEDKIIKTGDDDDLLDKHQNKIASLLNDLCEQV